MVLSHARVPELSTYQALQMKYFTLLILIASLLIQTVDAKNEEQKAVVITGASSGLGKKIAEHLADNGVFVFAGARKQKDIDALSAKKNIQGIRLDVTKQKEIDEAVDFVRKQGKGLHGLVNNAGVFVYGPLIEVSEADLQFQMDVNVFGPYRVTKAFAPLIIESKGRITSTGSISGVLMPGSLFGPYAMSKYAVEAYTDALASEMKKFDVQVSVIQPGNFKSDIMKNMRARSEKVLQSTKSLYADEYKRLEGFTQADRSMQKEPTPVAEAVMHALFSDNPKRRYMVVPNKREADFTMRNQFSRINMLNQGHEFTKSKEELSSFFDAAVKE